MSLPPLAVLLLAPLLALALAPPAGAQSLEDRRDALRQAMKDVHFGQSIIALADLTNEQELSASRYDIDDAQGTSIVTFSLPYRTTFPFEEEGGQALYLEASIGYLVAKGELENLFEGGSPFEVAGYHAKWQALGGLVGVGFQQPVAKGFSLTPILDVSLIHMENDTIYTGPGGPAIEPVMDGIVFNWDATTLGLGGALRSDWVGRFSEAVDFELIGRYDLRYFETLHSTDTAQELSELSHFFTGRFRVSGPTGISLHRHPLGWRADLGYRRYVGRTASALEFTDFVELGGALDLRLQEFPVLSSFTLSGSVLYGHNVTGWTLGVGASF